MNRYRPSYEEFALPRFGFVHSGLPPVDRRRADAGLGVSADRAAAPSFLFESVIGGEKVGRFSFLGTEPFLRFEAAARMRDDPARPTPTASPGASRRADPFRDLEELVERYRTVPLKGLPRFVGGAVGFASYDAVRYTENLPDVPPDDRGIPDLSFAFYDRMVLFDHIRKTVLVVALAHVGPGVDPRAAYETACDRIDELVGRLAGPAPTWVCAISTRIRRSRSSRGRISPGPSMRRSCGIARNTSRPATSFRSCPASDSRSRRRPIRSISTACCGWSIPARFCFICRMAISALDRLLAGDPGAGRRRDGDDPAAGGHAPPRVPTRPRTRPWPKSCWPIPRSAPSTSCWSTWGATTSVAWPNISTVQLTDVMKVERYSHVMHITSNVTGRLRAGQTAFDALRAGLPAGTVSGAPKVRAMQIIDEVEPQKRGPYGGAVGYIDFTGNMDTCIALRTLVLQGKTAYIQAGGGVVYDSDPGR